MNRPILLSLLGLAVALAAVGLALSLGAEDERRLEVLPPPPVTVPAPPATGTLDVEVVRIGEKGDTVIAGRAEPKTEITVWMNGQPIGAVTADSRGEWVIVPNAPLPAGLQMLTLGEKDGPISVVATLIPTQRDQQAHAILLPPDGKMRVLARPTDLEHSPLYLERDPGGPLRISGRTEANRLIQAISSGRTLAKAVSDVNGDWILSIAEISTDKLGLEIQDSKSKAKSRRDLPVPPPAPIGQAPSAERIAPDTVRIALPDGRAVHLITPHAAP